MTIPSPRTFFEIVAFIIFALFTCTGMILALVPLAMIWSCENAYDKARAWQARRRA